MSADHNATIATETPPALVAARSSAVLDGEWKHVMCCAQNVKRTYLDFVKASDALAKAMGWREEYVLRKVLPQKSDDRRNGKRIVDWVAEQQKEVTEWWEELARKRALREERDALIARLGLTDEQVATLRMVEAV